MNTNLLVLLLGMVFSLLAIWYFIRFVRAWQKLRASLEWVSITGSVTAAIIESDTIPLLDLPHYYAVAYYTYVVLGVDHEGKTKMDSILGLKSTAESKAMAYLPRTPLLVRYNPDKPEESLSELDRVSLNDLILSFAFLAFAGLLLSFLCLRPPA